MSAPGPAWSAEEEELLRSLAAAGESATAIATLLKRKPAGVHQRAHLLEIKLARSLPGPKPSGSDPVRAPRISSNDDKSPLIGLLSCIVCKETMKLEKSAPDAEGKDIIQYRCKRCGRIELVRLIRRSRDAVG